MDIFINTFLALHITAGAIALLVAPVAIAVQKGGEAHKRWGRVFFWSMTVIFITAIILALYKWNLFLLMIAVFSYYSVVSAYRWLYLKKMHLGQRPKKIDWFALIVAALFNLWFVGWGIYMATNGHYGFFAYLAIGFGTAGLLTAKGNLMKFLKHPPKNTWIYEHIGGMLGGYIATVTAFSSQVMVFLPGWMQWIWPTLVGVPVIMYWTRRYRNRLEKLDTAL